MGSPRHPAGSLAPWVVGTGALFPTLGCVLGALQTPLSSTKSPIALGGWIPAKELEKK